MMRMARREDAGTALDFPSERPPRLNVRHRSQILSTGCRQVLQRLIAENRPAGCAELLPAPPAGRPDWE